MIVDRVAVIGKFFTMKACALMWLVLLGRRKNAGLVHYFGL
ncbi:hypothetical protein [Pararhizobium sp. IMCC21322]|nr:hypothetical protein [Pararhizobium sp. IMCC21322]